MTTRRAFAFTGLAAAAGGEVMPLLAQRGRARGGNAAAKALTRNGARVLHGSAGRDDRIRLFTAAETLFDDLENTGLVEDIPAIMQEALNRNPSLLNPTDDELIAALAANKIYVPSLPIRTPIAMSDVAPMFAPQGLRAMQMQFLRTLSVDGEVIPAKFMMTIGEMEEAGAAAAVGAGFIALGAALGGIGGSGAAATVSTIALVGIGGAFVVAGAAIWITYEIAKANRAAKTAPSSYETPRFYNWREYENARS